MTRNFRTLGLALLGLLAIAGLAAPAAQAGFFEWQSGATKMTVVQDPTFGSQQFGTTSGTTTCEQVSGQAPLFGTSSETLTIEGIAYKNALSSKCSGPFGTTPTVEMNGCSYRLHAGLTLGEPVEIPVTSMDVLCPKEKEIVISAPGCTTKITAQNGLTSGNARTIAGSPEKITLELNINNIWYHHSGFLCGEGTPTNGSYKGQFLLSASNSAGVGVNATVT